MKPVSLVLLAASLLASAPARHTNAATVVADPAWPADSGPTLTPEQLRMQIQRLTPQQRQELLRSLGGGFRTENARPGGPRGGDGFAPGGPNGPSPRFGGGSRQPGEGGFAPRGPAQGRPEMGDGQGRQGMQPQVASRLAEIANLPPERRQAQLEQMRNRFQNRMRDLRQQQQSGALDPQQQRQLPELEAMARRLDQLINLPPEERDARLNEMRNRVGAGGGGEPGFGPRRGNPPANQEQGQGFNAPQRPRRPIQSSPGDSNGLPPRNSGEGAPQN